MENIRETLENAFNENEASSDVDQPLNKDVKADEEIEQNQENIENNEEKTVESPIDPDQEKPARKAPSSWKPAAQEAFLKADRGEALTSEEIKLLTQEAERRESDFHKGVTEFKTHAERAKAYDSAIEPYRDHLKSLGVEAPTAINALLRADVILRTSDPVTKAQYFNKLAREYGIDINAATSAPQVDPQTQYLMNQLQNLQNQQEMWQNKLAEQERQQALSSIKEFESQAPHLDAVRGEMADLLESGKAKTLQEAYDLAVWMRPETRKTLVDQMRTEAQNKALEQAQAKKAKTASMSVKGSNPSSVKNVSPKGSVRDILSSQFSD